MKNHTLLLVLALGMNALNSQMAHAENFPTGFVCEATVLHSYCDSGTIRVVIRADGRFLLFDDIDAHCWLPAENVKGTFTARNGSHAGLPLVLYDLGIQGLLEYSANQKLAILTQGDVMRNLMCHDLAITIPSPAPSPGKGHVCSLAPFCFDHADGHGCVCDSDSPTPTPTPSYTPPAQSCRPGYFPDGNGGCEYGGGW